MKPLFHHRLVNGPGGDPALYVEFLFERRALLFDLGDIAALAPRKVLRLSHVFVSHAHMDHFAGLDRLVRVCLGRPRTVRIYGPPGFVDQVTSRLAGYTWNLVESYRADFTLLVTEVHPDGRTRGARLRCRARFRAEPLAGGQLGADGTLVDGEGWRVRVALLDHRIPCLGFAVDEKQHVNIWKNRLREMGLPVGPWLSALKRSVLRGDADDTSFRVRWQDGELTRERVCRLGALRSRVVRVTRGQTLAYVVDMAHSRENVRRVTALARGADQFYVEAPFLHAEAARAAATSHLTARQAGALARRAGVARCIPFHFSARHTGDEQRLVDEAMAAFLGDEEPGAQPPDSTFTVAASPDTT